MKKALAVPILVLAMVGGPAFAAGDIAQGQAKAVLCATCHGADGMREIPLLMGGSSHLAGMEPGKFVEAINSYRYGRRFHPMMQFFVMPLSDQDVADMAAYYASLGTKH
jgi:cytochrome c553